MPPVTEGRLAHWSAGAGLSCYNPDLGRGRLYGATLWVDYGLEAVPFLHNVSLELEAFDLHFDRPASSPFLREDTAGMGVTYTWPHLRNVRPYAKVIAGLGNIDYFATRNLRYNQSRTVVNMGGGLEFKAYRRLWVRADYEYEYLTDFWVTNVSKSNSGAPLDPQGVTVGVVYHFSREHPAH